MYSSQLQMEKELFRSQTTTATTTTLHESLNHLCPFFFREDAPNNFVWPPIEFLFYKARGGLDRYEPTLCIHSYRRHTGPFAPSKKGGGKNRGKLGRKRTKRQGRYI